MKLKTYILDDFFGEDIELAPIIHRYQTNNVLAIELFDVRNNEEFAFLTVNLKDQILTNHDSGSFVDTNNHEWAERFIDKYCLGVKTGIYGEGGFCKYPEFVFDISKLNREEDY